MWKKSQGEIMEEYLAIYKVLLQKKRLDNQFSIVSLFITNERK
jgi:hypothetical protein